MADKQLFVRLGLKSDTYTRGMRAAQREARLFQKNVDTVTTAVKRTAVAFAAFGTVAAAVSIRLVKVASDAEEIGSKFNVVFRDLKGEASDWARDFGQSVGRANQDVKKWMAGLQDTFVPLGYARDQAYEMSKQLTQLAVDVASFNNAADSEVIANFTSAIVGNHEAVRSYGIVITEASLKQEALAQGIKTAWNEMTNQQKAGLRLSLILKGTTDAQGDAIRTADSYANQIKRLQANITDTSESIGNLLLPTATRIVTKTNEWIKANQGLVQVKIKEYLEGIAGAAAKVAEHKDTIFAILEVAAWTASALAIGKVATKLWSIAGALAAIAQTPAAVLSGMGIVAGYGMYKHATSGGNQPATSILSRGALGRRGLNFGTGRGRGYEPSGMFSNIGLTQMSGYQFSLRNPNAGASVAATPAGGTAAAPALNNSFELSLMQMSAAAGGTMAKARQYSAQLPQSGGLANQFGTPTQLQSINEGWLRLGDTMSSVMTNAVQQSGNMAMNIVRNFSNMLMQMATELVSKSAIFGVLNLLTGGSFGLAQGGLSGFLGFRSIGIQGFANGGYLNSRKPVLVGERGPELFVPSGAGKVVPNSDIDQSRMTVVFNGSPGNLNNRLDMVQWMRDAWRRGELKFMTQGA